MARATDKLVIQTKAERHAYTFLHEQLKQRAEAYTRRANEIAATSGNELVKADYLRKADILFRFAIQLNPLGIEKVPDK